MTNPRTKFTEGEKNKNIKLHIRKSCKHFYLGHTEPDICAFQLRCSGAFPSRKKKASQTNLKFFSESLPKQDLKYELPILVLMLEDLVEGELS